MKKRNLQKFMGIFMAVVMLLGLMPAVVFAEENLHASHLGYVTHIEATEGNCTTPGNIEFWYCDYYTCRKYYSDEAMTTEINISDTVITPGEHSDDCIDCGYETVEETFGLFVPSEHPLYDEDDYRNSGLHILVDKLVGFRFIFVGEDSEGNLYAMGNATNEDGSREAVDITEYVNDDGTVTVDSDTVEFFTCEEIPNTYTFSPDNGYMSVFDEKIVVHGQNIKDAEDDIRIPQSIRFEQNWEDLSDYSEDKGYLFAWDLNSGIIVFDSEGSAPSFKATLTWTEENGESIDNRAHNIMLYMERCEHTNMTHTEASELSCTEDGIIEHWYCEDCRMYFSDEYGTEYIYLPDGETDYEDYLYTRTWGHSYGENCICENCGETCPHPDAVYEEVEYVEETCFEPGMNGYWFCEECYRYLDENKENGFWEYMDAAKIPAPGHAFNKDTGKCDTCGLPNPVYKKVTSLSDVTEEDLYIIVAEVEGDDGKEYFALGGLDESNPSENGSICCKEETGNAIPVVPEDDGSISVLNQNQASGAKPSEFMFDIAPEQFGSGLEEFGLTTLMFKLPNHCVYPFQSYSHDNNGYMGIPRYTYEYGHWDSSDWIIDFYTTEKDENTYNDGIFSDEEGLTHAEQIEDGNIGENITEGNLIMYNSSFVSVGGAMFTLRLREYDGQFYFICGEDWALEGSDGWDYVTDTTPTNDTQYAVWLYRYDAPAVDSHTCEFTGLKDNKDGTHTGYCECGEEETNPHTWDKGTETKTPTCTEEGEMTYSCTSECGATKTEAIGILEHEWSDWVSSGREEHLKICSGCKDEITSSHNWDKGEVIEQATVYKDGTIKYTCPECKATRTEIIPAITCDHNFGSFIADDDYTHTKICMNANGCTAYMSSEHEWDNGTITVEATETEEGTMVYTCIVCNHTLNEKIPMIEHRHSFGDWVSNEEGGHIRYCENGNNCTATEKAEHICEIWNDDKDGKHSGTCTDCGEEMSENHSWSRWEKGTTETSFVRSCKCGAIEEMTVQEPISNTVINTTKADSNYAGAELVVNNPLDLFNGALDETEQTKVAEGTAAVSVYLEVKDIPEDEVSSSDKAAAAEVMENGDNELDENTEIGMYLDINLFKEVTITDEGNSETKESKVAETSGNITVSIKIPDELINEDDSLKRVYRIIRIHHDESGKIITDVIEGIFDPVNKTFTFETDKFSTYILAYTDDSAIIYGDVNGDGEVTRNDLLRLAKHFSGYTVEIDETASDVNGDGEVTRHDLLRLAKYFSGYSVTLGK